MAWRKFATVNPGIIAPWQLVVQNRKKSQKPQTTIAIDSWEKKCFAKIKVTGFVNFGVDGLKIVPM